MDFDSFIAQAWKDHADDSPGVALRLQEQGPALSAARPRWRRWR